MWSSRAVVIEPVGLERGALRVVQLGRGENLRAAVAPGHEDAAVGEQGGRVEVASGRHRTRRAGARRRRWCRGRGDGRRGGGHRPGGSGRHGQGRRWRRGRSGGAPSQQDGDRQTDEDRSRREAQAHRSSSLGAHRYTRVGFAQWPSALPPTPKDPEQGRLAPQGLFGLAASTLPAAGGLTAAVTHERAARAASRADNWPRIPTGGQATHPERGSRGRSTTHSAPQPWPRRVCRARALRRASRAKWAFLAYAARRWRSSIGSTPSGSTARSNESRNAAAGVAGRLPRVVPRVQREGPDAAAEMRIAVPSSAADHVLPPSR